jgi:hypothetical protein
MHFLVSIESKTALHTIGGLSNGTGTLERPSKLFVQPFGDDVAGSIWEPKAMYGVGGEAEDETREPQSTASIVQKVRSK